MIRRRTFLIALGLTGLSGPALAAAQATGRIPRIGYISNVPPSTLLADAWRKAFVDGFAVLANPGNASHAPRTKEIAEAARTLKLQSDVVEVRAGPEPKNGAGSRPDDPSRPTGPRRRGHPMNAFSAA